MRTFLLIGAAALGAVFLLRPVSAEPARALPPPAIDLPAGSGLQKAVFSGGCFWGVQGVFEHLTGVVRAVSGYAGGQARTAQYETVSSGETGHAESVEVTYDPAKISYGTMLRVFFSVALDPTQRDAQGPDEGTQYRSELWVTSPEQRRVAKAYIRQLEDGHAFAKPIATRVDDLPGFYPAEPYHQDFLALHPAYPYIAINDIPKVNALKAAFPALYRAKPVLTGIGS